MTNSAAAETVLLSETLFRIISAFQHGMYADVRPLKALERVSSYEIQHGTSMSSNHRAALARADALLAPWYAAYGTLHIQCLFQWFKHTYDVVAAHAVYFGHLEVLEYIHGVYTIGFFRDLPLLNMAAANGHLHVLTFLHMHRYMACLEHYAGWSSRALTWAAAAGHLTTVEWLHNHNIPCDSTDAQDAAAEFGQLEILQWLHARDIGQLTTWAMDKAAKNGHLDVLKWLHDHTHASCTTNAMDEAARCGHLDVLEWLHHHRSDGATDASIRNAAENGHADVLRWIFVHEPPTSTCSTWPMDTAAQHGHVEAIRVLHEHGWPASSRAMDKAAGGGFLNVVQWLHANRNEGCTTFAMDDAACEGHLEVIQWLHRHRAEGCSTNALDLACLHGHVKVAWWLIEHRTEGCSDDGVLRGVEYAIKRGHLDLVQWFCRHHAGVQAWKGSLAISEARRFGHHKIASYLKTGRPDTCPCNKCARSPAPAYCSVQ
ncbi:Aste57867_14581 [Aphanomyces stellatus]|uniref:Aste57867_14581 protein n=1 Tax=Aphanomyces stellatus TaxID=120398 RepID=A0A485L118_9STRA|nr:hypothetical protein As57867_014527 [Aphanomyces stellatus]VFT91400.1 Aste57867_14581 [Aphanomyces stellatus]